MSIIKNILLAPYWLVSVFTQAKSFKDNPVIGSSLLNRCGLHVFRLRLAHFMTSFRRWMLRGLIDKDLRERFDRDGYVTIENFLPADKFEALKAELRGADLQIRRMRQGDTDTLTSLFDDEALAALPHMRALIEDRRVLGLTSYVGARWKYPLSMALTVKNGLHPGRNADPQKSFHSDTFHPTMKAWLFLADVPPKKGPFHFVPGSHRLTPERRAWEKEQSLSASSGGNRYAAKGSLRASPEDLARIGCREPVPMVVSANTLVIADTHGFHRRGDAAPGAVRPAIYFSSRSNPFNPWPGAPLWAWRRLEHWFMTREWRGADEVEAKGGKKASWRLAPDADLFSPEPKRVVRGPAQDRRAAG